MAAVASSVKMYQCCESDGDIMKSTAVMIVVFLPLDSAHLLLFG